MTRRTATTLATLPTHPNVPHVVGVDPTIDDVSTFVRAHRSITGSEPDRVWFGPMRMETARRILNDSYDRIAREQWRSMTPEDRRAMAEPGPIPPEDLDAALEEVDR